ncbi:hypothetical protein QUG98_08515 [Curtobacterium sp. RHCJP20]|uniref:Uncharacterized protein n=1 Tax=Curtobacterium subtropicum TaxID=3055138 RepID=A0ABT7THT1_9MICO|nr:hypothetical protein [Curtobacterium subtropicum]MDM7888497.1 hypothetical protein [Curtobacterium subtropicum]
MKIISSPSRGAALVGPGYFRGLNEESLAAAKILYGDPQPGNDRQFDLWRAMSLQGTTPAS